MSVCLQNLHAVIFSPTTVSDISLFGPERLYNTLEVMVSLIEIMLPRNLYYPYKNFLGVTPGALCKHRVVLFFTAIII